MWWGGGGGNRDQQNPSEEGNPTSPIAITGRGRRRKQSTDSSTSSPPSSSPLSSSLGSSYGSPGSDLAEMRDLKNNFSNQEQLLGQLRDVLQSNNQRLQSKEKEDYASRLAQMRSNRKGGAISKVAPVVEQKKEDTEAAGKKSRGARMQMLRKQLEESKVRQDAELSSRQDLENIVAGLQRELEERDSMIQNLQLGSVSGSVTSSVLGSPFVMSPDQGSPTDSPGNSTPPAGYSEGYGSSSSYYDLKELVSAKDNKILEQNEKIAHFNRRVWDLEEGLKEKDEIISARTQAVGLASASLAAKGKDTLDQLEDTRQELRSLQENWSREQGEWRKEREETRILLEGANARVESLQEANRRLERSREEIGSKNQELKEMVGKLEDDLAGVKSRAREDKILLEARVEEIEEERNALDEKIVKKEEILEKRIHSLESRSKENTPEGEEEERIGELENALAEAEEERGALQLKLVDLEEMAAAEQKLKARVKDAEESSRRVGDELDSQRRAASMAESDKIDLMEAVATRDTEIEALQAEIGKLVSGREELARERLELEIRCVQLEEERDKWEGEKLEFIQQIEEIKSQAKVDILPLKELTIKHAELVTEHDKFSKEHAAAMDRSRLYDKDMLDKSRKIKEQTINLKTLENLLHEKTKEISFQLSEVDLKQKELIKAKETIVNFEDVISKKESELTELKTILGESEEHSKLINMNNRIDELEKDLNILIEDKSTLEQEIEQKNNYFETLQQTFELQKEELYKLLEENNTKKVVVDDNNNKMLKRIQELEEVVESSSIELEEERQKLEASLHENKEINSLSETKKLAFEEIQTRLELAEKALEEQHVKFEEVQKALESKTLEMREANNINEEISQQIETYENEIKCLRQNVSDKEESSSKNAKESDDLSKEFRVKMEKIQSLELDVEMKSEEIQTMNEEVMSKYKIIEELQTQIDSLEQTCSLANEKESDLKSSNGELLEEISQLKNTSQNQIDELASQNTGLERLQTVIDVLEKEGQSSESDLSNQLIKSNEELSLKEKEIVKLKKEVELLTGEIANVDVEENNKLYKQLEEMSITLTSLQQMKENYEEKIRTLENENNSLEELSADIAESRRQILKKDEDIASLQEKLEIKVSELSKKETENFDIQNSDKDEFYEKQQAEQIQILRIQLKEKCELLQAGVGDEKLKSKLEEKGEDIELKNQEIEDLRIVIKKSEVETIKLESRMAEIEQFRQEVAKEANQHMEETGDKIRELKTQFENKQEEATQLIQEKEELDSNLQRISGELKSLEAKYNDLLKKSSNADLIKEKDLLKEKNEKLTSMCKKYLAKVKQQEAIMKEKEGLVENNQIEEFNTKISKFELEINQAKAENAILTDEMASKYQIIEDLQNQIEQKEAECEKWERECSEKENRLMQKEIEKDDIIRELKQKLEEAPEDISIPVNVAEAALAHEKTKTELLNLREKCKKLIVKVKQQDAQIKRKARDSTSSEASVAPNEDNEASSQEIEKLKKENKELKKVQEELSVTSSNHIGQLQKEIDSFKKNQEDISYSEEFDQMMNEIQELKKRNEDFVKERNDTDLHGENYKLKEKLETLKKERTALNEDHLSLKETIKELNMTNKHLGNRVEETIDELKKIRESNIVNQMAASPMLSQEKGSAFGGFGEDGDDGWVSPEPEAEKVAVEAEAESDGWGGWGTTEEIEDIKSPDVEDGLNVIEVQKEEPTNAEGWGGWDEEMATPATPSPVPTDPDTTPAAFPDGPRNEGGQLVEREADIEDGWGDDSWGGFGVDNSQGNSALAANLRIGEKDDDGLAGVARADSAEIREGSAGPSGTQTDSSRSMALQLQGKVAEKESVIESMENELKNLKQRFETVEEELITIQEQKDEVEKQFTKERKLKAMQETENEKLKEKVSELSKLIEESETLKTNVDKFQTEKYCLEENLKETIEAKEELERKILTLEEASKDMEGLFGVEENYKECLTTINNLEEQIVQADMNSQSIENKLKLDIEKKQLEINYVEIEMKNLTEQLETSENSLTDLNETVGKLSERRNSLDSTVNDLQATVSKHKEEVEIYQTKIAAMESQGDRTEEIVHLNNQVQQLSNKLQSKNEEIEQLSILRNNLFTDNDALKTNYNQQIKLNQQQCESISSSEDRLNALQVELQQSVALAEEDQLKMRNSKQELEKQLGSLHSMVMDVTSENETIQAELVSAQHQISADQDQINQLQSDLNAVPRPSVQHPPPDITNNGQQPDVAARNVNPDIMRGPINPGPDIMQGPVNVNPDIMGGAQPLQQPLDLVQQQQGWGWGDNNDAAEAAGWFDDFEAEPPQYQIPDVEQVHAQIQQAHAGNREHELQQTISVQTSTIHQHEHTIQQHETNFQLQQSRMQELDVAIRQHKDNIKQHLAKIEQYRNADENNLKAIEQLEANIWQITDEKQQLALKSVNFEAHIHELMSEQDQLKSKASETEQLQSKIAEANMSLGNKDNECELLRSQLNQANTHSTCEAELARQYEQLQTAQTSLEKLSNDYQNILSELEETRNKNQSVEEQITLSQSSQFSAGSELVMAATAPVKISHQQESHEHHYQSPPPAVFNWNAVAEVKEDNASAFFAAPHQDHSAASFFEDIGAPSAVPQVDNFFEGIDTPQPTVPAHPTAVYQQEPQPNSPHSNSYNELVNLQDQLRMKVVHSEQLSTDLNDLRIQLEDKQLEAESLHTELEKVKVEKFQEISMLQEDLESSQNSSAEKESLAEQVLLLTDSMTLSKITIEDLQGKLIKLRESIPEEDHTEGQNTTLMAQPLQQQDATSTSALFEQIETTSSFRADEIESTASLFGQEQTASTSSLFGQEKTNSTASLFGQEETTTTASIFGQETTSSTSSLFGQEQSIAPSESVNDAALPTVTELKPDEMLANLTWYQTELAQYQQACADWQVWGDTKSQEINELNESLSYQTEAFRIKNAENEKLTQQMKEKEESNKKNDMQNMLKLKELEVLDLKETVERFESEKEELSEEINEMRNTIDELRSINDNVESYRDDSAMLDDTKNNLDEVTRERAKLNSELTDLRNEMATVRFSNDKTIKDLRNEMEGKIQEIDNLNKRVFDATEKIKDLEKSLEEEKKMQEEIGDEYEGMQLQVQESTARISELVKEIDFLKMESDTKIEEDKQVKEVLISLDSASVEELTQKATDLTAELDQYKQTCLDWNAWSENKTLEYNQLLEAYNQYVEAYNNLKAEFDSVLEQSVKTAEDTESVKTTEDTESVKTAEDTESIKTPEETDNSKEHEKEIRENKATIEQLKLEIESNEKEIAFSSVEKNSEIDKLNLEIEEKSKELEELLGVEERYKTSLSNISELEEQMIQADMNAESNELKLKLDIEERETSIATLQEEVKKLTEQKEIQNISEIANLTEELDGKVMEMEGKALEYNTLLEAYNQYVVAYDFINNEFTTLKNQSSYLPAQEAANADQQRNNQPEKEQEENDENQSIVELQTLLLEKETIITELRQQVDLKEKELVEKTCAVAKMNISSALSKSLQVIKQTSTEVKPVEKVLEISNQSSENISPDESVVETTSEIVEVAAEQPWEESEGWGVEETAEVQQSSSSEVLLLETEISELRQKIRELEDEKSKNTDDLNSAKLKNGKFLVKVKQLTKEMETLKKSKSKSPELDDLDRALHDEIKHQAEKCQADLKESRKEIDNLRIEKEYLAKKLDTLETANERLIEMKEKQDNEVEFLQHNNKDLGNQIDGLNWNISELEERRESEVAELTNKLTVFTSQENVDLDSNQLKTEIASLKSQLSEAHKESDRLRSDLSATNEALVMAHSETATVKSQIIDLQDSIDRLVNEKENIQAENDNLKGVSGSESEGFDEIQKLNATLNNEIASLKDYIENQNLYSTPAITSQSQDISEVNHLKAQIQREQNLVIHLEQDLQAKESSLDMLENELMSVREQKTHQEVELRSKLESPRESFDREILSAFSDHDLVSENLQLKADLDSSMRERRQMAGCIQNWTEELNKDEISSLGEDGLRQELSIAIKTLQIKDHKCEEITTENIRLIEERDTLMLKLSTVMRQLEGSRTASAMSSMAGSRTTTPVPGAGAMPSIMPHFDPHAEIRGLHSKLEELRRLNYSLDVELQRERGDRVNMEQRVMAPRSRHASQMLPDNKKSESPVKVQHI